MSTSRVNGSVQADRSRLRAIQGRARRRVRVLAHAALQPRGAAAICQEGGQERLCALLQDSVKFWVLWPRAGVGGVSSLKQ